MLKINKKINIKHPGGAGRQDDIVNIHKIPEI